MTVQVRDNNTKTIIKTVRVNDMTTMYVKYVDEFRRKYNNATIEVFYGNPNGKATTTYKTFH